MSLINILAIDLLPSFNFISFDFKMYFNY